MNARVISTLLVLFLLRGSAALAETNIKKQPFGATDGKQADLYTLTNHNGLEVAITNYGGSVVSLTVPDRKGQLGDIVLGYDNLDGYVNDKAYLGALIGRYGNRIAHGKFSLNGITYTLARNNDDNHLHGGVKGFNKALWQAKELTTGNGPALELTYLSKDGEEGYPGDLAVKVVYTLTEQNELKIEYSASTDKDTVLNLTHHSYFNLAGAGSGDILQHQVMLRAGRFLPVDATLIPTGELRSVAGSPFDFRTPAAIGARINQDDEQLKYGRGYDHSWALDSGGGEPPVLAAQVVEPQSGRTMEVWTTEPAIQFYTGNFLDGLHGKSGKVYDRRHAFCLETQHFPDSPNHPAFPSTTLKAGRQFHSVTIYRFSAK
jgi:aldose 1-epimerase